MSWMFANGLGDWSSIPGRVLPKTQKLILDATLHYKARIKGEVEQSRQWSNALGVVAIEKGAFGSPLTKVTNFTFSLFQIFKTMDKCEFCMLIKHCFLVVKITVQAKPRLIKCYLDSAPLETMIKRWYADFKCSHTYANDAKCSGRPNLAVVMENTKKLHKLILADCELKLQDIAEEL